MGSAAAGVGGLQGWWRVTGPEDAGIGLTPATAANAAYDRSRPAYDQLTSTWAALIGPTPGSSSSHGATAATSRSSSARSSAASAANSLDALGGRAQRPHGRAVLQRPGRPVPEPRATCDLAFGGQPAKFGPQLLGRPDDQRLELVGGADLSRARAVADRQQHPQRFPVGWTSRTGSAAGDLGGAEPPRSRWARSGPRSRRRRGWPAAC
jgi:hypothetical protein